MEKPVLIGLCVLAVLDCGCAAKRPRPPAIAESIAADACVRATVCVRDYAIKNAASSLTATELTEAGAVACSMSFREYLDAKTAELQSRTRRKATAKRAVAQAIRSQQHCETFAKGKALQALAEVR